MRLWSIIFIFALATIVGVIVVHDPGYALFGYGDWTAEMPLWLAILFFLIISLIIIFILFLFNFIFKSHHHIRRWWKGRKQRNSRRDMARGLLKMAEGNYQKAEHYLSKSAKNSDNPVINYLSAAKAAIETGSTERRDHYLKMASSLSDGNEIVVHLTEAELQYDEGNYSKCLAILLALETENPKHPQVLKKLCQVYESMNDWQAIYRLLPKVRKYHVFLNKDAEFGLEKKVYLALLPFFANQGHKALIHFWKSAPSSIKNDIDCMKLYTQCLTEKERPEVALHLLQSYLHKKWQDDLGYLYGLIKGPSPKKQLSFMESLIQHEPENAILFLSLGRLALRNHLWGKARDYLEQSLYLKPTAETYALLGQLMDQLGQPEKRNDYFKKGLFMVTKDSVEQL